MDKKIYIYTFTGGSFPWWYLGPRNFPIKQEEKKNHKVNFYREFFHNPETVHTYIMF